MRTAQDRIKQAIDGIGFSLGARGGHYPLAQENASRRYRDKRVRLR
jgi:hypothetical protein